MWGERDSSVPSAAVCFYWNIHMFMLDAVVLYISSYRICMRHFGGFPSSISPVMALTMDLVKVSYEC